MFPSIQGLGDINGAEGESSEPGLGDGGKEERRGRRGCKKHLILFLSSSCSLCFGFHGN